MAGAYLATNLITSSATITASSENSSYPTGNLYDKQAPNVFRCESGSSLTLLIDFGSAQAADTIALINHNLTASATLDLKADNSTPPTTAIATPSYRQYDLWKAFTSMAARYWLLTIADSNPADIEIGQLLIGARIALPTARRIGEGYKPSRERSNISGETYAGVFWNYHLYDRLNFNPSFRVGSAADFAVLNTLDRTVYGNLWPFLYIPDSSGANCYYVRKEQGFAPEEINRLAGLELVHDYRMLLIEESRGLNIQS